MFANVGGKQSLVDRVVDAIQEKIASGALKPGMMLPPERELCAQFAVSRTALREAVRMLVSKGLLETRSGVGTTVRQPTSSHVLEPLSMLVSTSNGAISLDHLHHVRSILEVENARRAAEKSTAGDIERLESLLAQMAAAQDDRHEFARLDSEFHRFIAETTGNPLLTILLDTIRDLLGRVREQVWHRNLSRAVLPDHRRIAQLIGAHEPEGAAQAMREHLEHARAIQHEMLGQSSIPKGGANEPGTQEGR